MDRAKKVLLTYGDFRSEYPEKARLARPDYVEGIPPLPDFFTVMRYIRAFDTLHRLNKLSPNEVAICEKTIVESISYMLRTQEWGAMNRSDPPGRNPGLGRPGPARPQRRGRLGHAEKSPGRR